MPCSIILSIIGMCKYQELCWNFEVIMYTLTEKKYLQIVQGTLMEQPVKVTGRLFTLIQQSDKRQNTLMQQTIKQR